MRLLIYLVPNNCRFDGQQERSDAFAWAKLINALEYTRTQIIVHADNVTARRFDKSNLSRETDASPLLPK